LIKYALIPAIIFLFSLLLRDVLFNGFVLGDDPQEMSASVYMMANPPDLHDAFHIRFGVWLYNAAFFNLLGVSEFSFFLPTLLMSASFAVIGYFLLLRWGYGELNSFLAGILIASAPFEVLIGVVRANDLIFSWFLALGFLSFVMLEKKPILQGVLVATFLWLAFYVKLWVIYLLPPLFLYYLYWFVKKREWKGPLSFALVTLLLHGAMGLYFQRNIGTFFPFFAEHSATYPVESSSLVWLFSLYPQAVFVGSQFGTTLFGCIPYLLVFLLSVKLLLMFVKPKSKFAGFDKWDLYMIAFYISFFLLLEFFPNTFVFDQYYSAPRIFRYLAPISFPMTLHLAKLVLDTGKTRLFPPSMKKYGPAILLGLLMFVNIVQAGDATSPGRSYRSALLSVLRDIKTLSPTKVICESWLKYFMEEVYLKGTGISVVSAPDYTIDTAPKYESWIRNAAPSIDDGTVLVTGLGSYVHYGCLGCGFRLALFANPLDPSWKLYSTYNLSYLDPPEPARVWVKTS